MKLSSDNMKPGVILIFFLVFLYTHVAVCIYVIDMKREVLQLNEKVANLLARGG